MENAVRPEDASPSLSEMLISTPWTFSKPYREPSSVGALQMTTVKKVRTLPFITTTVLPYNIPVPPFIYIFSYFFDMGFQIRC